MADLDRIRGNVKKMLDAGAPESDVDAYLGQEGVTAAALRAPKPDAFAGEKTGAIPAVDSLYRFMRGFGGARDQGVFFGLGDELKAGVSALTGGDYGKTLTQERGINTEFSNEHPVLSVGANVAGGIAAAPGVARALSMLPGAGSLTNAVARLPAWAQAASAGGATGAAVGFAEGEGGLGPRMESAGKGAALGALTGTVAPAIIRGAANLASPVIDRFRDPGRVAGRKVLERLADDGLTPDGAIARMRDLGPDAVLGDVGENTMGLARAAANVPGQGKALARDVLEARQAGRGQRILSSAEQNMGANPNFFDQADELMRRRSVDAQPLYDRAFERTGVWNDRVQSFLDDPIARRGLREGIEIQRLEALAEGRPFNPSDLAVTGFNDAGDPILGGVPNMRTLDAVKRGLDNILEGYRDPTSGRLALDQRGRAIDQVRRSFVRTLDDINPDYAAARQSWSGPSQSLDALNAGRRFVSGDTEVMSRRLADLSPNDQEFFRTGALRAIRDMILTDTRAAARKFGDNKSAFWNKLEQVFPDQQSFDAFRTTVQNELAKGRLEGAALTGSRTTPLARDIQDLEHAPNPLLDFGADLLTNHRTAIPRAIARAGNAVADRVRLPTENIANETARMLYQQDPQEVQRIIDRLRALPPPRPMYGRSPGLLGAGIGAGTGLLTN